MTDMMVSTGELVLRGHVVPKLVAMVDIDGVLRNFMSSWILRWWGIYGEGPQFNPYAWNCIEQAGDHVGLSQTQSYDLIFRTHGFDVMALAQPYPNAIEMMGLLRRMGYTIVLATAQATPEIQRGTQAWLRLHKVPYDYLVWATNKAVVQADLYIDDRQETLQMLRETYPAAWIVGVDRPWNNPGIIEGVIETKHYGEIAVTAMGLRDIWERQIFKTLEQDWGLRVAPWAR